jgi:hypothetical protein
MDELWYYAREGQSLGPVAFAELKKMAAAGQLAPTDMVCPVGSQQWQVASSVRDLMVALPPAAAEPIPVLELDESIALKAADAEKERERERDRERDRDRDRDRDRGRDDYRDRDYRDDRREPRGDPLEFVKTILRRSFTMDFSTIQPSEEEARQLKRAGITEPTAQRYLIWRKSLLWFIVVPTAFAALFHLITLLAMDKAQSDKWSRFGMALHYIQALALIALPVTATIAAMKFDQPRKSMRILILGVLIAFGVRIVAALIPAEHWTETKSAEERFEAAVTMGLILFITLIPTVLTPLPAIWRACTRMKMLLPASIVPGWGFIASAPMYLLLGFATFVFIYQMAGNFLLVLGLMLWFGAPLIHFSRTDLWIRPITRTKDLKALTKLNYFVLIAVVAGIALIIIFLLTAKVRNAYLVGFDKNESVWRPWNLNLHNFWIEFVGKSLFLTVLFADLMMQMNLSIWNQEKQFYRTEAAAGYDKEMQNLQSVLVPPPMLHDEDESINDRRRDDDDRRRD